MKILKDFVSKEYQDKLEDIVLGDAIAWHWNPKTVYVDDSNLNDCVVTPQTKEMWHLVHLTTSKNGTVHSPVHKMFLPLIRSAGIGNFEIDRIKANCMFKQPDYPVGFYNTPHVDNEKPEYQTLLYYINDSDGDTLIFDKRYQEGVKHTELTIKYRYTPKKGTAILFDSNLFHCGTPPIVTDRRALVNIIFRVK